MKILVTGFKAFQGEAINPSGELVKNLRLPSGSKTMILPVAYDQVFDLVKSEFEKDSYDFLLMLGQAGGRKSVDLERVAVNMQDQDQPDEVGRKYLETVIDPVGPSAILVDFPLRVWAQALKQKGHSIEVSHSAGSFVCNNLYFRVLNHIRSNPEMNMKALFIHLPYCVEQMPGKEGRIPHLSLFQMKSAVEAVIELMKGHRCN